MVDTTVIERINKVIAAHFINNNILTSIPVKDLMLAFINAGIFVKDIKKGLPIRKILNDLVKTEQLHLIPFVYTERHERNTYWYFKPINAPIPTSPYKQLKSQGQIDKSFKSDEAYIIDLCDNELGQKAFRQKKFNFLEGDLHKNGKSKTKLPVDAYYEELQLAIEYKDNRNSDSDKNTKRQEKETVSGMPRSEQRKRYEARIAKALPAHGINLICISSTSFSCDTQHKIIRNKKTDINIIQKALSKYITKN